MKFHVALLSFIAIATAAQAQESASDTTKKRLKPLVEGGIADKPFITTLAGRTSLGGYTEAVFLYEREAGVTHEMTFEPRRLNLFTYSALSDRVTFFSEIEIEEGGEELRIETAVVDFVISEAFALRGGILLSPLSKFNLSHDTPRNELNDRPLVATDLIGVTLSEPGMGLFGSLYPFEQLRLTYELYAVNGYNDGLINESALTRIPAGKPGLGADNNNRPAVVGRIAANLGKIDFGVSAHNGSYNVFEVDGRKVDEARSLRIVAMDAEWQWRDLNLRGEFAAAEIEIPNSLSAIYADQQRGFYAQAAQRFGKGWFTLLPASYWTGVVRLDQVDFDSDLEGDSHTRLSVGLNFRPIPDTVFKLDYHRDWLRDRFDTKVDAAGILFGMATYF